MDDFVWLSLDSSVQGALKKILADERLESNVKLDVCRGTKLGDGYGSKTYAITLSGREEKLNLFVKYFPLDTTQQKDVIIAVFRSERTFYSDIYPALIKFQAERGIKDPFDNVPKYYRVDTSIGITPVVMENLKVKGYALRERQCHIDEEHLKLVLRTFGKFHASSFALKDQEYEIFANITGSITDVFTKIVTENGFDKVIENCINQFITNLNPITDEDILKISDGLAKSLVDFVANVECCLGKYCTILQGDCWSNNMMFLYADSKTPLDIKLIDWQMLKVNCPAFDLTYFFYSAATPEMLENWERHIQFYYEHFSEHCRNLGSDPNRLYPFEVLKDHWKQHAKYGLATAFVLVKGMLLDEDEAPDTAKSLKNEMLDEDMFSKKTRHQDVYDKRMKDIIRHFIKNKFI